MLSSSKVLVNDLFILSQEAKQFFIFLLNLVLFFVTFMSTIP